MSQFARPDSDVDVGTWTTAPLYPNIDEVTASDADFMRSASGPTNSLCVIGLSDVGDPESSSDHVVRFRHREGGTGATVTLLVELMQGGTVIASTTVNEVSTTWTAGTFTLSGAEADAITDYLDLRLRWTANQTAGTARPKQMSWAELELPNAPVPPPSEHIGWGIPL